jgi:N utilization substance protein B
MSARSKGRKRALDILYESDIKSVNPLWLAKERTTSSDEISLFAAEIVEGYGGQALAIDDRLASVDRNIMRIATYEILHYAERAVPVSVAIDEAIELAKMLSTDESPQYIHGILSAIARENGGLEVSK